MKALSRGTDWHSYLVNARIPLELWILHNNLNSDLGYEFHTIEKYFVQIIDYMRLRIS